MTEITVTLTEAEARSLLPHGPMNDEGWNRRIDLAEEAQAKIKRAIREQGSLLGEVA